VNPSTASSRVSDHPAPRIPRRLRTFRGLAVSGIVLALLGACASPSTRPAPSGAASPAIGAALPDRRSGDASRTARSNASPGAGSPTLYGEIGGREGVASLTERFIREIAADDRIKSHYQDSDIGRFHRMMQLQMCERTGGGCAYTGDDMRSTHGGMNITPTEFNGIVEALMRAMDAEGLSVSTQNRLLAIYAPMREDIIDR